MPVYIGKSGDLVGCYRCLTHSQTENSATQLVSSIKHKLSHAIQSVNILGRIEYVVGGVGALDVPTGGLAMHPTICSLVTMCKVEKENMMMTATSI